MNIINAALFCAVIAVAGCGPSERRPVELFAEDECAHCRMSVSDPRYASEIISAQDEIFKFDDLSCLESFRKNRTDVHISAMFVKDFETEQWLPYEKSIIIQTGVDTPMGSGRIAVSSAERAKAVRNTFPATDDQCTDNCCGS